MGTSRAAHGLLFHGATRVSSTSPYFAHYYSCPGLFAVRCSPFQSHQPPSHLSVRLPSLFPSACSQAHVPTVSPHPPPIPRLFPGPVCAAAPDVRVVREARAPDVRGPAWRPLAPPPLVSMWDTVFALSPTSLPIRTFAAVSVPSDAPVTPHRPILSAAWYVPRYIAKFAGPP
ncbi:hypothetical protein K466DRAFT_579821 [Polyporus arcularius HHB13444]|uniref:Uncharacterized protein n=1 Tax=Polyporus arcularius HHB13444 TaxID=1314778 RepID=A0A5C3Q0I7_9APHY|nr:hypothetical protein K466DRAFT_579821 [Polyporus arcularius HHB13444]